MITSACGSVVAYSCICAQLSSCGRCSTICKAENIHHLTLYRKSFTTPALLPFQQRMLLFEHPKNGSQFLALRKASVQVLLLQAFNLRLMVAETDLSLLHTRSWDLSLFYSGI